MTGRALAVYVAVALLLGPIRAQDNKPGSNGPPGSAGDGLTWAHSTTEAFKTAAEKKRPVLFCIMKDKEIGCRRMLDTAYRDAKVREKLAQFVLVPCSTYMHVTPEINSDGKLVAGCPQFPGVSCAEHQSCEREMRTRFQESETVIAPQHIMCDAEGRVLERKPYEMKAAGFVEFLDRGLAAFRGEPPESKPAVAGAAPDAAGRKAWSPAVEALCQRIAHGEPADRDAATKELLRVEGAERVEAFLATLKDMKGSKDRGDTVRGGGYPECSASAVGLTALLAEKDTYLRNCAVVTLEEMANTDTGMKLLEVLKGEKDPEVRKDIVRALGPTGGGREEIANALVHELSSSAENVRVAACLSLGYFAVSRPAVVKDLKAKWAKDGSLKIKTAILWGLTMSESPTSASIIDDLLKDENNAQVKRVGEFAKARLTGAPEPPPGGGGGGRRGAGGAGGRFGVMKLLQPLYADDKIVRNRIKEFMQAFK